MKLFKKFKMNEKYIELIKEMHLGKCIMIDGATGTELERRGVPQIPNAWNGGGALSHPEILEEIHKEYIELGARIIITNTFATGKHTLEDANQIHNFEKLNSQGVLIAKKACKEVNKNSLIAGGISYWTFTKNKPSLEILRSNVKEQALIFKNNGVNLLILEMMEDIERMMVTLEGAKNANLPIWVGLSCKKDSSGKVVLLSGDPLEKAIDNLNNKNVDLINIMHTEIPLINPCLDILQNKWKGLIGVYAHSGVMEKTKWTFEEVISPEQYSKYVKEWIERGINKVEGCCTITTEHIRYLSENNY